MHVLTRVSHVRSLVLHYAIASFLAVPVLAQDEELDPETRRQIELYQSIKWEIGPTTVDIGSNSQIQVPEGYQYTDRVGSQIWNQLTQNPPDGTIGTLMPTDDDLSWFICFEFHDIGYVNDEEKNNLDADAILETVRQGTEESNEYRRSQGWGTIETLGWIVSPKYDQASNSLVWALRLRDVESQIQSSNYSIRLLGRRGVMNVTLVDGVDTMMSSVASVNSLLNNFEFKSGHKHSEFEDGDKLAEYGLTGLIAGGAAVAAVKTGLFGKLIAMVGKFAKVIFIGIAVVLGAIWRALTGRPKTGQPS